MKSRMLAPDSGRGWVDWLRTGQPNLNRETKSSGANGDRASSTGHKQISPADFSTPVKRKDFENAVFFFDRLFSGANEKQARIFIGIV